jgi:FkbM family methyltransferase
MYLWIDPHESDRDLAFLHAYLQEGDFVIDVGANIGETVLTAWTRVGEQGSIMAFEPHPRTFRFLERNLALNGVCNVQAFNLGLGDEKGLVGFADERREDLNCVDRANSSFTVRLERLDSIAPAGRMVNLLKVDVEGYEKFVFAGATEVLQQTQCVYFEVSASHFRRFGYSTRDLLHLLVGKGFSLFRIREPKVLTPITTDFDTSRFENLVAMRDAQEVRRRTGWTFEEA